MKEYLGHYNQALSELKVFRQCQLAFVTKLKEAFQVDHNLVVVYEYCDSGNLKQFISQHLGYPITERVICQILIQIVYVLVYMRENKILYKGLTPDNILIQKDQIRINDFGIDNLVELPKPGYQVPEFLFEKRFSYKSVMFQLGLILYELAMQRPLLKFDAVDQVKSFIQNGGVIVKIPATYSRQLRFIISTCLEIREADRLDIRQLIQNENFKTLQNHKHFEFSFEQLSVFEFWTNHKTNKAKRPSIITHNFDLQLPPPNTASKQFEPSEFNTSLKARRVPKLILRKQTDINSLSRPITQDQSRAAPITLTRSNFQRSHPHSLTTHRRQVYSRCSNNTEEQFIQKPTYLEDPQKPVASINNLIKQKLEQCVGTIGIEETRKEINRLRSGGSVKDFLAKYPNHKFQQIARHMVDIIQFTQI